MFSDVGPAVPQSEEAVCRRGIVAAVVLQALLVEMARPAVKFYNHSVFAVADVAEDLPPAFHARGLAIRGWQAMSSLHVSQVPVLQRRVHSVGDVLEGEANLSAPAHLWACFQRGGQQVWR